MMILMKSFWKMMASIRHAVSSMKKICCVGYSLVNFRNCGLIGYFDIHSEAFQAFMDSPWARCEYHVVNWP